MLVGVQSDIVLSSANYHIKWQFHLTNYVILFVYFSVMVFVCSGVIVLPPLHSSQSTWNHFSSEQFSHPTQLLCSSDIQVSSTCTITPATCSHTVYGHNTGALPNGSMQSSDMVLDWRRDQNEMVSRDSDDSRLAKTRDHIQPKSGSYARGRQLSVIGCKDDVIYNDVGLQTGGNCDMIQSETVAHGRDCGQKNAATTVVVNVASSSSGQYRHRGATERGTNINMKDFELEF